MNYSSTNFFLLRRSPTDQFIFDKSSYVIKHEIKTFKVISFIKIGDFISLEINNELEHGIATCMEHEYMLLMILL